MKCSCNFQQFFFRYAHHHINCIVQSCRPAVMPPLKRSTKNNSKPYSKPIKSLKRKSLVAMDKDRQKQIDEDIENELLKSDSDCSQSSFRTAAASAPSIDSANSEVMLLLRKIHEEQCTKGDLDILQQTINSKFVVIDNKIDSHSSMIENLSKRLDDFESTSAAGKYESEIYKQKSIRNNLSIMGVPRMDNEDLKRIAINIFAFIGCNIVIADRR